MQRGRHEQRVGYLWEVMIYTPDLRLRRRLFDTQQEASAYQDRMERMADALFVWL